MPATVAQAPAVATDIEAATRTNNNREQAVTTGDIAVVEVEAEPDGGATQDARPDPRRSDFPFFALGFAAVVSLIFVVSDLMNGRMAHPISGGVFLLSTSYIVAILRRQRAGSRESGAGGTAEAAPGGRKRLSKEAREELFTYFVFSCPATPTAAASEPPPAAAAAAASEGEDRHHQTQPDQRAQGLSSTSNALQESNGSRKERRGAGSCGSKGNDDAGAGTDAGSLPSSTAAASPSPSSPVSSGGQGRERQRRSVDAGGSGSTVGSYGDATAASTGTAASAAAAAAAVAVAVAVAPTPNAAGGGLFKDHDHDSGEWSTDQVCIVCFGEYAPGDRLCRLPCRHVYHAKCIDEWFDRARLPCCPLCKVDLLQTAHPAGRSGTAAPRGTGSARASSGGGGRGRGAGGGRRWFGGRGGFAGDDMV